MIRSALCRAIWLCALPVALWAGAGAVWLDVPFVQQEKNACGAASVAMLMQYWQAQLRQPVNADAGQIQRALYSPKAHGIYASDLEKYLNEHGYRTFALRGSWDDLEQQLRKGRPLIVALKTGRDEFHYVVITGVDAQENVVLKNDPAERKLLKQDRTSFEKEWTAAANWTLLAVPESQ